MTFTNLHTNELLYLCYTIKAVVKWLKRAHISDHDFEIFQQQTYQQKSQSYNTFKAKHCTMKCKTRGILLAATNCGIVISFRELFGAESLKQVAQLYLDTFDLFEGHDGNILSLLKKMIEKSD